MNDKFNTAALIPGPWTDKTDLSAALMTRKKYLFAGLLLMDIKTHETFTAELKQDWSAEDYFAEFAPLLSDQDTEMAYPPAESLFIIEAETGSFQELQRLCDAVTEILKIGGYGVKLINSGKVVSQKVWGTLSFSAQTLFELFVSIYPVEKGILTCGMSNFGKRDVFVPLILDDEGENFILSYAWYIVNEQPEIKAGETFSLLKNSPVFKIFEEEDDMRGPEHPFYNPYGLWKVWPQEWLEN
ncbi:MAG: DUF4261 domain-containing protein [Alphaproteobacteria bacterium]|nr:DUF4261 domain-containing protein [Alphaproteobacteria bacterium]